MELCPILSVSELSSRLCDFIGHGPDLQALISAVPDLSNVEVRDESYFDGSEWQRRAMVSMECSIDESYIPVRHPLTSRCFASISRPISMEFPIPIAELVIVMECGGDTFIDLPSSMGIIAIVWRHTQAHLHLLGQCHIAQLYGENSPGEITLSPSISVGRACLDDDMPPHFLDNIEVDDLSVYLDGHRDPHFPIVRRSLRFGYTDTSVEFDRPSRLCVTSDGWERA